MIRQLVMDLLHRPAMGRQDFFVSSANAAAVAVIEGWHDWPHGKLVLTGPEAAGKSHLAHVWAGLTGATVVLAKALSDEHADSLADVPAVAVEDIEAIAGDGAAEEALFHLHNALAARGVPLLMTSRVSPTRIGFSLPDLASRLAQSAVATLSAPDDALLTAVMMKVAHDRRLPVSPVILSYALPRIERSFAAGTRFIAQLDERALSEKRPPTREMARQVLAGQW